tara:strand:- start:193 stop:372 length:180 start_codon:yes stop_codon:yes gene_type:complete
MNYFDEVRCMIGELADHLWTNQISLPEDIIEQLKGLMELSVVYNPQPPQNEMPNGDNNE